MPSPQVICCIHLLSLLRNVIKDASSVDPDKTAHVGADCSGYTLFAKEMSKTFQLTRIGAFGLIVRYSYQDHSDSLVECLT